MKRIFFAAALAVVAIGGAVSANADSLYASGSNTAVPCNIGASASCTAQIGSSTAFLRPADDPDGQGDPVNANDYTYSPN